MGISHGVTRDQYLRLQIHPEAWFVYITAPDHLLETDL